MATISAYLKRAEDVPRGAFVFDPTPEYVEVVAKSRPKKDRPYQLEYTQPRNLQHHRYYWTLLGKLANALNDGPGNEVWNAPLIHEWTCFEIGHVRVRKLTDPVQIAKYGERIVERKSINFRTMDGHEWTVFWERARRALVTRLVPEAVLSAASDEVDAMLYGAPLTNRHHNGGPKITDNESENA